MSKLNYRTATFQDGASLMDYATRWGDDTDIVTGAFCRHCGTVMEAHTWPQSVEIANYGTVEGLTVCSCSAQDPINHP